MRWRGFAMVSLGLNAVLGVAWLLAGRHTTGPTKASAAPEGPPPPAKTNLVVRRQFFTWRDIESPDYPTYIANLRGIGCPEQTVRDIIIADVNGLYARRRATELVTPEQQWWRSEPDTNVLQQAVQKVRDLEEERRALLARLLGSNWESGDMLSLPRPTRPGVVLDGPVLGTLAPETKQTLQEINVRSQDRLNAYLEAQQQSGKAPDPAELAKLRQQTRNELQRVLTPPQLEEYLLRYSQDANNLRADFGELRFFDATPDEFRAVFRATDTLDQQIASLAGNDPATVQQRRVLEDQRDNAIRLALGTQRYTEYRSLHDPLYREAVALAQEAGTPEAVQALYAINLAAQSEQDSIRTNADLTAEQKAIELKRIELEQMRANAVATDQELPPEPPAPPPPVPKRVYILGPGDTAATVATIYGVPITVLREANPNVNLSRLKPGDSLVIPRNPLAPSPSP